MVFQERAVKMKWRKSISVFILLIGIAIGVPPAVTVAHKFGEKSDATDGTVQLHDCGIVYYPQHPYLACVMSKGPDFEALDDVIAGVSRIIFAEIDAQHRKH